MTVCLIFLIMACSNIPGKTPVSTCKCYLSAHPVLIAKFVPDLSDKQLTPMAATVMLLKKIGRHFSDIDLEL